MIDKLLLEHVGLPLVLDLAVHLVNFFGWSQGGHSEQLLFFAHFYQSTPSCLKVVGGGVVGWGGGPCDYCVSPSPAQIPIPIGTGDDNKVLWATTPPTYNF